MTEAMPFLQKAILLSYAPRSLAWEFFIRLSNMYCSPTRGRESLFSETCRTAQFCHWPLLCIMRYGTVKQKRGCMEGINLKEECLICKAPLSSRAVKPLPCGMGI